MTEIKRHENESTASALRRFTKRVQQAGILVEARRRRFRKRQPSEYKKRKSALNRIRKRAAVEKMRKLGKIN